MRKKKFTYVALALLTLGFAACQQEEDFALQGQEQVLRIATRSTSDVNAAVSFTDDFTLELWSTTDNAKYETHSMIYTDGTGWNTVRSSILPANAFAYKGSSVTDISYTDKWNYTVSLQLDQSDATKLADADVMIATGSANAESLLDLNFEHFFAKVTFNATLAIEFDATDNITTFDVKTVDSKTVNACIDGKTVSAIITSGQYAAESEFLSIKVSGADNPLTVKVPSGGLTFNAGTHYTFNLKVGKDKVTIEQVSMDDFDSPFGEGWNNEENLM